MENRQFKRSGGGNGQFKGLKNPSMSQGEQDRYQSMPPPDFFVDQVTAQIPALSEPRVVQPPMAPPPVALSNRRPNVVQRLVSDVLSKGREPEPERWSHTLRLKVINAQSRLLGWYPMLAITHAVGILLGVFACDYSLRTADDQEIFLWLGLALIFGPSFFRLMSPLASRIERLVLVCSIGMSSYLVKVLLSPTRFIFIDEYYHLKTIDDILKTGHLFAENSMLQVSPPYPGLEVVTHALITLSGLDTTTSAYIVVGVSRLILVLSLFLFYEQVAKSARIASIATLFYMTNLGFFFFNSLFVYETLGLALGVFMLFTLVRMETLNSGAGWLLFISWLAMTGLVATHHVSDFVFIGFLLVWVVVQKFLHQPVLRQNSTKTVLFGVVLSLIWVLVIARPVIGYLTDPVINAAGNLQKVLTGTSGARHLFIDKVGGHPTPLWERLLMLGSMALTVLGIPFGCLYIWHRYSRKALPLMLGLIALVYPLTQAFRLTSDPEGLSDRATPFIFIAVGFALAIFVIQLWPTRKLNWKQMFPLALAASVCFVGGGLLGGGPSWTLMPGTFVVGDDNRSIDPQGIQAATWMLAHMGPNNRISTDRSDRLLMGTYGYQRIVTAPDDKIFISPVFYAARFDPWEIDILRSGHVHYLEVDTRLSNSLPFKGFYYDQGEPESYDAVSPITRQALIKFATVPQINRIFDSGDIVIYDVGGLLNASKKS